MKLIKITVSQRTVHLTSVHSFNQIIYTLCNPHRLVQVASTYSKWTEGINSSTDLHSSSVHNKAHKRVT